ncbi:radical SAM protein [Desulforegula conservatrix]|uniref:radical SAM protein n=1 Tax=Desulforegula conservatrix TaxID=153026 RepID=UPI00041A9DF5|nr:radical SAM protein [Desulforegula conservatrix]
MKDSITLITSSLRFLAIRTGFLKPCVPINLTFSVTNICQSRCKTCSIWKLYKDNPEKRQEELTIQEIRKIFEPMGRIYVFNVSGGEPFLRDDFPEIIKLACTYLKPSVIHIPTNAIAEKKIRKNLIVILDYLKNNYPNVKLTIKPSLDHIGKKHDEIRGINGNFEKVISVFKWLKSLKTDYPFLHAELGTVVSSWNVRDIGKISKYVKTLNPDSYRNEIAEKRSEMFNTGEPITPGPNAYRKAIDFFVKEIKSQMKNKSLFQRITNAFRLVYYDLAIKIMEEKKQVIPCYAGISNVHMTAYGDIWPCCTLGYDKSMGNLRDFDYDFKKLWNSRQALMIRMSIYNKECHCPLANQTYSNILLEPRSLIKVLKIIILSR